MKRLTLICGPSGIGKSTLAEALVDKLGGIWREADTYFINDDMQYVFNHADLPKAHQWCQDECREWMLAGCENIVISNTFTTMWERKPYIDLAREHGYEVVIIKAFPVDLKAERLAQLSTHDVPVNVVQNQMNRMF
jgi:predicted kinase